MRKTPFATVIFFTAAVLATSASSALAREDGPRLAQDRLDELVAQHKEANRHIASSDPQDKRAHRRTAASAS